MSRLDHQHPIDIALVDWLVQNGHVGYMGLIKIREALTTEGVVLGFPVQLFDAREQLLTRVDQWIADVEDQVRRHNRAAGLGDFNGGPDEP